MRQIITGLLILAGISVPILIRQGIINPASWFMKDEPETPPSISQPVDIGVGVPSTSSGPFMLLVALNRDAQGYNVSRAGKVVQQSQIIQKLVNELNATLKLPKNIPIRLKPCGGPDAYYDPQDGAITICDEWLYFQEKVFSPYYNSQEEFSHAVLGSTAFTLFHEIGHALIDQLSLPVLGREEDAADQIATFLLTTSGSADLAFRGGEFFAYFADGYQPGSDFPYWDEHGLNEQRFYNISCLLYGYDPGRFAFMVADHTLPLDRAQRCPEEARKSAASIAALLQPWLK